MGNIDWIQGLELFKHNPYLMFGAFIFLIAIVGFLTYKPKNKTGKIKSKKVKLHQKGLKDNEVGDIESDEVDIKQG